MTFHVYADSQSHLHVVKRGFAWPAFLVPEIWLFLRGLPADALVVIALFVGAIVALPPDLVALAGLSIRLLAGFVANRRIEATFRAKGWRRLDDVPARSHLDALNKAGTVSAAGGLTSA